MKYENVHMLTLKYLRFEILERKEIKINLS